MWVISCGVRESVFELFMVVKLQMASKAIENQGN